MSGEEEISVHQTHDLGKYSWERLISDKSKEVAYRILKCDKDASTSPLRSALCARYQHEYGDKWYLRYEEDVLGIPSTWEKSLLEQDSTDKILASVGEYDCCIHVFEIPKTPNWDERQHKVQQHRVNKHAYNSYVFNYGAADQEIKFMEGRPLWSEARFSFDKYNTGKDVPF